MFFSSDWNLVLHNTFTLSHVGIGYYVTDYSQYITS